MSDLQPWEERLGDVVAKLYAAMPDDVRQECHALADLSPEDAGIRIHMRPDDDALDVVWVNRWLGTTSMSWLMSGEVPS